MIVTNSWVALSSNSRSALDLYCLLVEWMPRAWVLGCFHGSSIDVAGVVCWIWGLICSLCAFCVYSQTMININENKNAISTSGEVVNSQYYAFPSSPLFVHPSQQQALYKEHGHLGQFKLPEISLLLNILHTSLVFPEKREKLGSKSC